MTIRASFLPIVVVTYDDDHEIVDVAIDWSDSFNEDDDGLPLEYTAWRDKQSLLTGPMDDLIRSGAFDGGLPRLAS